MNKSASIISPIHRPAIRKGGGWTHESPSNVVDWYTPSAVFEALGVEFDLDPCSPGTARSNVPARAAYTIADDGLSSPWDGLCWVNPPYDDTRTWLRKLAQHGNGIALVFARTDTKWFHEAVAIADLVCFTSGRIRFIDGRTMTPGGSPAPGPCSSRGDGRLPTRCALPDSDSASARTRPATSTRPHKNANEPRA